MSAEVIHLARVSRPTDELARRRATLDNVGRFARLRDFGFTIGQATALADARYDVDGVVVSKVGA